MGVRDAYGSYGSYRSSQGILKFFADVPKSANMQGRYLLNSGNAGQIPAEFNEILASVLNSVNKQGSCISHEKLRTVDVDSI